MTDEDLMKALYAEGLSPAVIAEKFELPLQKVRGILGLSVHDARIIRTYQRFWRLMGEQVMTSAQIGERMGQSSGYANAYLRKLEERGQVKRAGLEPRRVVLWQMVRIDELMPAEPEAEAA